MSRPGDYVDLHSHWIPDIDDGCRTLDEGIALLEGLYSIGFSTVIATPHMRPGMFENDRARLEAAFAAATEQMRDRADLPVVHLASEHYLDDQVFARLLAGEALPYPTASRLRGVLIELNPQIFPARLANRLVDLKRKGMVTVIAHPERYEPVWADDRCLDPLFDAGARLLLDVCAVVGKYGRAPQRAAEKLLEDGAYEAACSDAHKPQDVPEVERSIRRLEGLVGKEETRRLLSEAPRGILEGVL